MVDIKCKGTFKVLKSHLDKDGVMVIDRAELEEVSLVKEEPTQSFVSVPKEIEFVCSPLDADRGRWNNTSLLVNGHHLCGRNRYNNETHVEDFVWAFIPEEFKMLPLDCVLVPVKREDLKVGDWVFCLVKQTPDYNDQGMMRELRDIRNYCLILEEGIVRVSMVEPTLDICQQPRDNVDSFDWFKIEVF